MAQVGNWLWEKDEHKIQDYGNRTEQLLTS